MTNVAIHDYMIEQLKEREEKLISKVKEALAEIQLTKESIEFFEKEKKKSQAEDLGFSEKKGGMK